MALTDPPKHLAPPDYEPRRYKLTLQRDADGLKRIVVIGGASLIAARIHTWLDYPPSEWWLLNVERVRPE